MHIDYHFADTLWEEEHGGHLSAGFSPTKRVLLIKLCVAALQKVAVYIYLHNY
jgi:hypothetical protein